MVRDIFMLLYPCSTERENCILEKSVRLGNHFLFDIPCSHLPSPGAGLTRGGDWIWLEIHWTAPHDWQTPSAELCALCIISCESLFSYGSRCFFWSWCKIWKFRETFLSEIVNVYRKDKSSSGCALSVASSASWDAGGERRPEPRGAASVTSSQRHQPQPPTSQPSTKVRFKFGIPTFHFKRVFVKMCLTIKNNMW